MSTCLTAFTPVGYHYYPPYINISEAEDGRIVFTVRGEPTIHKLDVNDEKPLATVCADTVSMPIDREKAIEILTEALNKLQESSSDAE